MAASRRSRSESKAHPAVDGAKGDLPEATFVYGEPKTPQIPVFTAWSLGDSRETGVGDGHHLCADASAVHVPTTTSINWYDNSISTGPLQETNNKIQLLLTTSLRQSRTPVLQTQNPSRYTTLNTHKSDQVER